VKTVSLEIESDGALIRRFAKERDERAFTELVERHAALVAGVCARMLRQRQDAEDAFQAAFLVLARRANALKREGSLAGWLHAVAVRVCLKERTAGRRRDRRVQEAAQVARETNQIDHSRELQLVIDEALAQLPNDVRQVVVLCDLEGRARGEVAELLAIPLGTVSSRLARGREQLRKRLVRNGLAVATGGAALLLAQCSQAAPSVSRELIGATVRNADAFALGTAAAKATVNIRVVTLAEGVLRTMMLAQWKTVVCLVAIVATSMISSALVPHSMSVLTSSAFAETVVFDDFNDGNHADGDPTTWSLPYAPWNNGTLDAGSGSLVMRSNDDESYLIAIPDGQPVLTTTSIRARMRYTGTPEETSFKEGIGLLARGSVARGSYYTAGIEQHSGLLSIGFTGAGGFQNLADAATDLRPYDEDVVLQFDVVDNVLSLYAWRPNESQPTTPQVQVVSDLIPDGIAGLGYDPPSGNGTGIIRYIQIADTPIVPEPSGGALCAIGGTLLSLGLLFQRRRYRP